MSAPSAWRATHTMRAGWGYDTDTGNFRRSDRDTPVMVTEAARGFSHVRFYTQDGEYRHAARASLVPIGGAA